MRVRSLVLVALVFAAGAAAGCMSEERVSELAGDVAADHVSALEQRIREIEARLDGMEPRLESDLEARLDNMESRLEGDLEARVDDMEWRLEEACSRLGC